MTKEPKSRIRYGFCNVDRVEYSSSPEEHVLDPQPFEVQTANVVAFGRLVICVLDPQVALVLSHEYIPAIPAVLSGGESYDGVFWVHCRLNDVSVATETRTDPSSSAYYFAASWSS